MVGLAWLIVFITPAGKREWAEHPLLGVVVAIVSTMSVGLVMSTASDLHTILVGFLTPLLGLATVRIRKARKSQR